jgi:hypothetical protein
MRNLLALLGLAVVLFLGVGYYRGWYDFQKTQTPTGSSIHFDVHTKKIGEDVKRGGSAVGEKINDLMENKPGEKSPPPPPR